MLPDREIHVVDSQGASMAEGILCLDAAGDGRRRAAGDRDRRRPRATRADDLRMYVALETLEYLKKGGRISGAQAAIGTLLSVKPIIAVEHGMVETAERARTRVEGARALHRAAHAPGRSSGSSILHTMAADVDGVQGRGRRAAAASTRHDVLGLDRRPVGRPAPRPGLRRRGRSLYQR